MLNQQEFESKLYSHLIAELRKAPADSNGQSELDLLKSRLQLEYEPAARRRLADEAKESFSRALQGQDEWPLYVAGKLEGTIQKLVHERVEMRLLNPTAFLGIPSDDSPHKQLGKIADSMKVLDVYTNRVAILISMLDRIETELKNHKDKQSYIAEAVAAGLTIVEEEAKEEPSLNPEYMETHYKERGLDIIGSYQSILPMLSDTITSCQLTNEAYPELIESTKRRARSCLALIEELHSQLERDIVGQELSIYFGPEEIERMRGLVTAIQGIEYVTQIVREEKLAKVPGSHTSFKWIGRNETAQLKFLFEQLCLRRFIYKEETSSGHFAQLFSGTGADKKIIWREKPGELVYLFTGLARQFLMLPNDVDEIIELEEPSSTQEQLFSGWLFPLLISGFYNRGPGVELTSPTLINAKNYYLNKREAGKPSRAGEIDAMIHGLEEFDTSNHT